MNNQYKALVVNKNEHGFTVNVDYVNHEQLNHGEVLIKVHYSALNYKDCLACIEDGKIVRSYPHVPGIDIVGVVVGSLDPRYKEGDQVIATSYDIGVSHFGGFREYATINADWVIPLPKQLTLREAIIVGTAGITAALSISKLELNGLSVGKDKTVLVTGATGGVGSLAVAMLAKRGYSVTACTRKQELHSYLIELGATQIITHEQLAGEKIKPLDQQIWDGAIDVVGGKTIASITSKLKYGASIAVSGLTGGSAIETTIFPFILRGVNILGIDSVYCNYTERQHIWSRIASDLKPANLEHIVNADISLEDIPHKVPLLLNGQSHGRYIVNLLN